MPSPVSDPRELQVERSRHAGGIERLHEQARVADLAPAPRAEEAAQLSLRRPPALGGLLLERAKGAQLALRVDDLLDRVDAERADQLVLEVGDAAAGLWAEPRALEAAAEIVFLARVAQAGERDVEAARAEALQLARDRLGAADRHHAHTLRGEIAAASAGERLDGRLVAQSFDEHDGTQLHDRIFAKPRARPASAAVRPFGALRPDSPTRSFRGLLHVRVRAARGRAGPSPQDGPPPSVISFAGFLSFQGVGASGGPS